MNRVTLHGRLAKDPESRTTKDDLTITTLTVATDDSYKNKDGERVDKAEFHRVVYMGKIAQNVSKYFKKGDGIITEGSLRHRSYEDSEGQTRYITEISGRSFEFPFGKAPDNQTKEATRSEGDNHEDDLPF